MRVYASWQDKCIDSQLLVASIVSLFKQRQLSLDKLLTGTGIFIADIRKPSHQISPKQLSRLLDNALSLWPSGDLSFLLGQQWLPSQSGVLTSGVFCAKNLYYLGQFWHKYHWLTQPWLQTWRWQGKEEWHYLLSLDLGMQRHQRFFIELTLSTLTACCKQLSGQVWQGSISFPYRAPDNLAPYYKYFGTDLSFDAPLCRVSMAKDVMQHPLLFARQSVAPNHHIANSARRLLMAQPYQLGLMAAIRRQLMHANLSLPETAKRLGISAATLKRRLGEMGVSYGQLVDETRLIKALYCLARPEQDANSIASKLCFSDASNFRRSFKRWTGQLPTYFRYWLA
ncbi:AraC family transcriptional regulator [Shewanella sp. A25]|nr:AraC family transcriptional regulator [Shewanella shenzhenensis]